MQLPRLYLISIILLIYTCYPSSAQTRWGKFQPAGQSFEILTPGEMKNGEKKILTEVGQLHPVTWLHQGDKNDPNYLYLISWVDYPEGTFHRDSTETIQEMFDISIETSLKDLGGTLAYKSESTYGGYPGMLYRVSYNNNRAVVKGKLVLANDRFYMLQVYTLSEKSMNYDMDRFLDSFRLNP